MTKLKDNLPLDILRTLYFGMIHSHLNLVGRMGLWLQSIDKITTEQYSPNF